MKKNKIRILSSIILILSALALTACNFDGGNENKTDTSSGSTTTTTTTTTTPPATTIPPVATPTTTQTVTTNGTIANDSIGTTSAGSLTVKTNSDGSHYEFISQEQTAASTANNIRTATVDTSKGGFWKFYTGNSTKPKFTGTYKGDVSKFAEVAVAMQSNVTAGEFKLSLTVTATTDDDGKLRTVSEAKTFDFEVKSSATSTETSSITFEAAIPSVTTTETEAQEPAAGNVTINTLAGTYAGAVMIDGAEASQDSVTITGDTYVWKKFTNDGSIYWRGKIFNKVSDNLFTLTNGERTETEENGQPVNWSKDGAIFIVSAAYNATEDTISFISTKGFNPQTNEWVTQPIENTVFRKVQQ